LACMSDAVGVALRAGLTAGAAAGNVAVDLFQGCALSVEVAGTVLGTMANGFALVSRHGVALAKEFEEGSLQSATVNFGYTYPAAPVAAIAPDSTIPTKSC
jgi:hypothetical protein